jgi:hypothetical protein
MEIVVSRLLDYTVYQVTRSILSWLLYIILKVVLVRNGLLLLIVD